MTPAAPAAGGGLFGGDPCGAVDRRRPLWWWRRLFGAAPAPALGGNTGLLGAPPAATARRPMQRAPSLENGLGDGEIFEQWQRQMVKAWDDKDYKLCSFKYVMFDDSRRRARWAHAAAHAGRAAGARRVARGVNAGMWERADAHNPNPARFVPRQITGFNALHERRIQQIQAARDIASKLRVGDDAEEARGRTPARSRARVAPLRGAAPDPVAPRAPSPRHHRAPASALPFRVEPPLNHAEQQWIGRLNELATEMERPDAGLMRLYDVSERLFRDPALQTSSVVTTGNLPRLTRPSR